jgi:hypothetical protein
MYFKGIIFLKELYLKNSDQTNTYKNIIQNLITKFL